MKIFRCCVFLLALLPLVQNCQTAGQANVVNETLPELVVYEGRPVPLVLDPFQWQAPQAQVVAETGALHNMLGISLLESGRFELLRGGAIPDRGTRNGAEFAIVQVQVLDYDPVNDVREGTDGASFLRRTWSRIAGVSRERGTCALRVRVIDGTTLALLGSADVLAESRTSDLGAGSTWGAWSHLRHLRGPLSVYEDRPMGKTLRLAVARTVDSVITSIPPKRFGYE